ncbi:MAG TPA: TadE/TadG family type IV pilus assembly protein [Solimonas sp.]|nr:TadE/TadG family type IV pilus assembly protein [Solimonas sp.]
MTNRPRVGGPGTKRAQGGAAKEFRSPALAHGAAAAGVIGKESRSPALAPGASGVIGREFRSPALAHGAAAVEFAFVFPILFLLIYGVIVYSYIFVIQESINFAAQEAAEAAVAVDPDEPDADVLRETAVRGAASATLGWLSESHRDRVLTTENFTVEFCHAGSATFCPVDSDAVRVTMRFDVAVTEPLFPVLNLYIVGKVPPLPKTLTAQAVARL